jgi:hypothetical protein
MKNYTFDWIEFKGSLQDGVKFHNYLVERAVGLAGLN